MLCVYLILVFDVKAQVGSDFRFSLKNNQQCYVSKNQNVQIKKGKKVNWPIKPRDPPAFTSSFTEN